MAEPSPEAATWRREGSGAVKAPGADAHGSDGAKTTLPGGRRGVRAAPESGRLGGLGAHPAPQRPHDRNAFEREDCLKGPETRGQLPAGLLPSGGESDAWFSPQDPKSQNRRYLPG